MPPGCLRGWRLACAALLALARGAAAITWPQRMAPALGEAQSDLSMVHVMYATTPDGFDGLIHSMTSLVRHSANPRQLTIHIVVPKQGMAQATHMVECFKSDHATPPIVDLQEMRAIPWDLSRVEPGHAYSRNNEFKADAVWARHYAQDYVPAPRVVWLDVDTIVQDDLGQLYRMPMKHAVAAHSTKDYRNVSTEFPDWKCVSAVGVDNSAKFKFFNTGVLLFDLAWWRSGDMSRKLAQISSACRCSEQPALNLLMLDNYDRLGEEWNRDFGSTSAGSPQGRVYPEANKILHWKGPLKPWRQPRTCRLPVVGLLNKKCLLPGNMNLYASYGSRQNCGVL